MEQDKPARFWAKARTKLYETFMRVTNFAKDYDPLTVTIRGGSRAYTAARNWFKPQEEFPPLFTDQKQTVDTMRATLKTFSEHRRRMAEQAKDIRTKPDLDGAGWAHYVDRRRRPSSR